jgi:hypothetical protein
VKLKVIPVNEKVAFELQYTSDFSISTFSCSPSSITLLGSSNISVVPFCHPWPEVDGHFFFSSSPIFIIKIPHRGLHLYCFIFTFYCFQFIAGAGKKKQARKFFKNILSYNYFVVNTDPTVKFLMKR